MYINWALQQINLKIVYYGPGVSGKTTNLLYIHSKVAPELKGELVSLQTQEDRTIFFDFLQLEVGKIKGKKPKFNLYTVPGQVYYAYSRKVILNGVDGVVFVADSQFDRLEANLETLNDLENNLKQDGHKMDEFPWVIQYNKRDLPNVAPIPYLQLKLNKYNVPYFEAVANKGIGVFETLKAVINLVVANVRKKL
ncbi:MAG TPA: GTPase domain-containing protein [Candidatus Limnocylindrales bacterium]|jgi:signal recognition particle receptor subunit beta|nr:GTPase domain-containing protein [Candidatus Limnocylindrales bacterium]